MQVLKWQLPALPCSVSARDFRQRTRHADTSTAHSHPESEPPALGGAGAA